MKYTEKDMDNAYDKGVSDALREMEYKYSNSLSSIIIENLKKIYPNFNEIIVTHEHVYCKPDCDSMGSWVRRCYIDGVEVFDIK